MLVLQLRKGERVYVGDACVIEFTAFESGQVVLSAWSGGRRRGYRLDYRRWQWLPVRDVRISPKATPIDGGTYALLSFDAPRHVPIVREEIVPEADRASVLAASGAPAAQAA